LERRKKILELLDLSGSVSVNELGKTFGVTLETVRRDVETLERAEQLTRTHGGAVPYEEAALDLSSEKRSAMNIEGKIAIAKKAIAHIRPGDTVFLDSSTTSFYLSKLVKEIRNITVITNSLPILNELCACEKIKLISVCGAFDPKDKSFAGETAVRNINGNFYADKLFFSSKGALAEKGILESNEFGYQIKRAMLENSGKKYYLADKSKFGAVGFIKLADFAEIDCLITDKHLYKSWRKLLAENKVTAE
jgi:DeoR/GlpR family transcriptional regulator of sugar metabolism